MPEPVIIDAIRTPIGALGGALAAVRPDDLAALVIKTILERNPIDPALVEEVYLGCANQAGEDNRNVARMASLLAGLPVETAGVTFNRLCASGLNAVNQAARAIRAGEGDVFIAGGVESMSRAPYSLPKAETAFAFGNLTAYDTALGWRYPNPKMQEMYGTDAMGETAENIAAMMPEITREQQDAFALRSHQLAIAAIDSGKFAEEIVPVSIPQRKGDPILVTTDERPRRDTTMESLGRLRAAFRKDGTVTAGNSSGLNDGAAALLLMSDDKAQALGLKPVARILTSAAAGVPPRIMGLGPVGAVRKASNPCRADPGPDRIGRAERSLCGAVLGCDQRIGAAGRPHQRERRRDRPRAPAGLLWGAHPDHPAARDAPPRPSQPRPFYGLATLCVGVGQGEATIVEWLE